MCVWVSEIAKTECMHFCNSMWRRKRNFWVPCMVPDISRLLAYVVAHTDWELCAVLLSCWLQARAKRKSYLKQYIQTLPKLQQALDAECAP